MKAEDRLSSAPPACLHTATGLLVGLRLSQLQEGGPAFRPLSPGGLWDALDHPGAIVSVRWLVVPAAAIGPPGHVEVLVLVHLGAAQARRDVVAELSALLGLAFPHHLFRPLATAEELHQALSPFEPVAWRSALVPLQPQESDPIGFEHLAGPRPDRQQPNLLEPIEPDPSRALQLLSAWPTASMLEWRLEPSGLDASRAGRLAARTPGPSAGAGPRFLSCQLLWSGAGGCPAVLAGVTLAQALGFPRATFEPVVAGTEASTTEEHLALDRLPAPNRLTLAVGTLPSMVPPPAALARLSPALRPALRPRLPDVLLPTHGVVIGTSLDGRAVRSSLEDRLRHTHLVGATGTGKSTYGENRFLQEIRKGHGGAWLDPHGDQVPSLEGLIPASRRADVLRIDLSAQPSELPCINLLECTDVAGAHLRSGQALELLSSLWPKEMTGPIFQQACLNAFLILAARFEEPGTMADLPNLFQDEQFRRGFLEAPGVADRVPAACAWWNLSYARYSDFTRSETQDYFTSKAAVINGDPTLRALVGRPFSTLDLRRVMDERRILLCSLGRHCMNPVATSLATGILMNAIFNAALSRADVPSSQRAPFFVYCDEFQRVAAPSTGAMLSEVRKYGVGMFLAHQFVDQLGAETLASVLGNVGTRLVFRVGLRDAARLTEHEPSVTVDELVRLPNFTAMAQVLVDGVPTAPFILRAPPPASWEVER